MSKFLYIVLPLASFGLGYFIADFKHFNHSQKISIDINNSKNKIDIIEPLQLNDQLLASTIKNKIDSNTLLNAQLSLSEQENIKQLIKNASDNKIERYIKQAFPDQNIDNINDKKMFAQRMIDEFNNNDETLEKFDGQLIISTTPIMPNNTENINEIHSHQAIFAHFDTFGKVPNNTQVFIKWINQNTNEVLLFTPKYIKSDHNQNWVSIVPNTGWKIGNYNVKVYEMNDSLAPIAQTTYTLTNVFQ